MKKTTILNIQSEVTIGSGASGCFVVDPYNFYIDMKKFNSDVADISATSPAVPEIANESLPETESGVSTDSEETLVEQIDVCACSMLTFEEIRFVEAIYPLFKDLAGLKVLNYSTKQLARIFQQVENSYHPSERTIQRRLLSLQRKRIINGSLKIFDLKLYLLLYYYSEVFVPLSRVFVPLTGEWSRRKKQVDTAMEVLNSYLEPLNIKVVR